MSTQDELLLARLRELSLVDLDALVAGASGAHYAELLAAYAEDLGDALSAARARARELLDTVAGGPDPLGLLDASFEIRTRQAGREAAERMAVRLAGRALACRSLARIDDLIVQLLPRVLEVDRRRAS